MRTDREGQMPGERLSQALRRLYTQYGYGAFSMNKLEEYAFYAPYMRFLERPEIVVFSDLDGRLMALKPDVTLSIVKNVEPELRGVRKLQYDENVFRPAAAAREFRELRQIGLECIGEVDRYTVAEVLSLAAESLAAVDAEYALDVSHLGVVSALLERLPDYSAREAVLACCKQKNPHDLMRAALAAGMDGRSAERLCGLVTLEGSFSEALAAAEALLDDGTARPALKELAALRELADCGRLRLNFSIVSDTDYYNGITFHGYVKRSPEAVLRGGQYDSLLEKMGKGGLRSIGFAVYFDALEPYYRTSRRRETDALVLYGRDTPAKTVRDTVAELRAAGLTVCANTAAPEDVSFGRVLDLRGEG